MRAWIACLLLLAACKGHGKAKPKPEAPPEPPPPVKADAPWFEDITDAPVAITAVKAKQATLHGYDQYLPVSFTITGKKPIIERTELMVKASCRVGALVMASAVPATIDLRQLEAATPQKLDTIPFGMDGFVGKAQPCELSWFLDEQQPGTKPRRFLRSCWSGGALSTGRCADLEPRPGVDPFKLASLAAAIEGDQLRLDATIVVGPHRTGDETAKLKTRCEVGGQVVEGEIASLANVGFLSAGEAYRATGTVDAAAPAWCEVRVVIERIVSGPPTELGKRCLRDGKLTDGGC